MLPKELALSLLFLLQASAQKPVFSDGLALYRGGKLSEAVKAFSALRGNGETTPLLDFYQGVCFAKLGDLPSASSLLLKYVSEQPADAHGWYWLGRVQLLQKEFADAHAAVQHAIDLDPKSWESFRTLGEVELELTNNDAAYRAWITANKLNPSDPQTTYHLGRLFFEAEFFQEATIWLGETLRLVPNHFSAMTYLGLCAEHLGDHKRALSSYREAIQQSKLQKAPNAWAYLSYAKLLRQVGLDREALAVLKESEELCPNASALSMLGQMLAADHEPDRAEAVLRRAMQMNPDLSEVHYRLSLLLRSKGDLEAAKSEMMRFEQTKKVEERRNNKISAVRLPDPNKH